MKEYIKPQINVKSLLQNADIANQWVEEGENGGKVVGVSAPNLWWPDNN